jgi:hypothetical protein
MIDPRKKTGVKVQDTREDSEGDDSMKENSTEIGPGVTERYREA